MVGTAYSGELATLSMSWYEAAPTMKERILLRCEIRRSNFCSQSTRLQSEMSRNLVCFGLNEHTSTLVLRSTFGVFFDAAS
jgi:hypothetical protein